MLKTVIDEQNIRKNNIYLKLKSFVTLEISLLINLTHPCQTKSYQLQRFEQYSVDSDAK